MAEEIKVHGGSCQCGEVEFEYRESTATQVVFNAICHCRLCRIITSQPFPHIMGVPKEAFSFTKGGENIKSYKTSGVLVQFCGSCGSRVTQGPESASFVGTYPTRYYTCSERFPTAVPDIFKAKFHLNMENSLFPELVKNDELPKFKDFPGAFGGSNVMYEYN